MYTWTLWSMAFVPESGFCPGIGFDKARLTVPPRSGLRDSSPDTGQMNACGSANGLSSTGGGATYARNGGTPPGIGSSSMRLFMYARVLLIGIVPAFQHFVRPDFAFAAFV